jgi:hypothetical protein
MMYAQLWIKCFACSIDARMGALASDMTGAEVADHGPMALPKPAFSVIVDIGHSGVALERRELAGW